LLIEKLQFIFLYNNVIILYAYADCTRKQEELTVLIAELTAEEASIVERQNGLKRELYGRFGDSINLEA
jgi:hypothetical protein